MKMTKKGFTLTEVLVVVLIISVLAAIVYPMYTKSITRSRAIEAINLLEMVRNKQLQKFARDQKYYTDLSKIGQLTSDSSAATVDGEKLKINDYTLSLDPVKNCMRAEYKKGSTEFTFSASYEKSGLGCTGAICSSFGSVTSTADQVCGCNITCSGGFTKDAASCSCTCSACVKDGQCVPAYLDKPLSDQILSYLLFAGEAAGRAGA
jgi:type IV pilus assembly protein PilE